MHIIDGTLVNTGENILYLSKALTTSSEVQNPTHTDNTDQYSVFFDFLGYILISYTGIYVTIIHILITIVGIVVVFLLSRTINNWSYIKLYSIIRAEIYCFFVPVLITSVYGLLVFLLAPMRWYEGGISIALLLYIPITILSILYIRGNMSITVLNTPYIRILAGLIFPWLIFLIIGIYFQLMSVYACCLWIISVTMSIIIYNFIKLYIINYSTPPNWYLYSAECIYILCYIPMLLQWAEISRLFLTMTIPLLGKSGTVVPTDPALGALIALLISAPASFIFAYEISRPIISKSTLKKCIIGIVVILVLCTVGLRPYSAQHPKRLWIQHIQRSFIKRSQYSTVGINHPNFDTMMREAISFGESSTVDTGDSSSLPHISFGESSTVDTGDSSSLPHISFGESSTTNDATTIDTFRDGDKYIPGRTTPSTYNNNVYMPNSIITNSINSFYPSTTAIAIETETNTDCGLWVLGFDEQGLAPLEKLGIPRLDGRYSHTCNVWDGDCYLKFPWYFSVSEVLRNNYYIPTACPVGMKSAELLKVHLYNHILSQQVINNIQSMATSDYALYHLRLVRISLQGPAHMHMILKDNALQQRIVRWYIPSTSTSATTTSTTTDTTNTATTSTIPHTYSNTEKLEQETDQLILYTTMSSTGDITSVTTDSTTIPHTDTIHTLYMVPPPPKRSEGLHYLSIGFGLCSHTDGCQQDIYLLIKGYEAVQIAAYGHYTDEKHDTIEITELLKELPDWSRGAEWTKFPSLFIQDSV